MRSRFQLSTTALAMLALMMLALLACSHDPLGSAPRSPMWPKVRAAHLKLHPVCEVCGCATDVEVHHIMPYHLKPELELSKDNLVTLGTKCPTGNHHFLFGHLGSWQSYNKDVVSDAAAWRKKIKERP